ncbi:unnamed protein product [Amoebophrya sp. A120]|nr:unnamed protein product [Amoebophrya sp. A120]|eukprot:GSA120T00011683001.1
MDNVVVEQEQILREQSTRNFEDMHPGQIEQLATEMGVRAEQLSMLWRHDASTQRKLLYEWALARARAQRADDRNHNRFAAGLRQATPTGNSDSFARRNAFVFGDDEDGENDDLDNATAEEWIDEANRAFDILQAAQGEENPQFLSESTDELDGSAVDSAENSGDEGGVAGRQTRRDHAGATDSTARAGNAGFNFSRYMQNWFGLSSYGALSPIRETTPGGQQQESNSSPDAAGAGDSAGTTSIRTGRARSGGNALAGMTSPTRPAGTTAPDIRGIRRGRDTPGTTGSSDGQVPQTAALLDAVSGASPGTTARQRSEPTFRDHVTLRWLQAQVMLTYAFEWTKSWLYPEPSVWDGQQGARAFSVQQKTSEQIYELAFGCGMRFYLNTLNQAEIRQMQLQTDTERKPLDVQHPRFPNIADRRRQLLTHEEFIEHLTAHLRFEQEEAQEAWNKLPFVNDKTTRISPYLGNQNGVLLAEDVTVRTEKGTVELNRLDYGETDPVRELDFQYWVRPTNADKSTKLRVKFRKIGKSRPVALDARQVIKISPLESKEEFMAHYRQDWPKVWEAALRRRGPNGNFFTKEEMCKKYGKDKGKKLWAAAWNWFDFDVKQFHWEDFKRQVLVRYRPKQFRQRFEEDFSNWARNRLKLMDATPLPEQEKEPERLRDLLQVDRDAYLLSSVIFQHDHGASAVSMEGFLWSCWRAVKSFWIRSLPRFLLDWVLGRGRAASSTGDADGGDQPDWPAGAGTTGSTSPGFLPTSGNGDEAPRNRDSAQARAEAARQAVEERKAADEMKKSLDLAAKAQLRSPMQRQAAHGLLYDKIMLKDILHVENKALLTAMIDLSYLVSSDLISPPPVFKDPQRLQVASTTADSGQHPDGGAVSTVGEQATSTAGASEQETGTSVSATTLPRGLRSRNRSARTLSDRESKRGSAAALAEARRIEEGSPFSLLPEIRVAGMAAVDEGALMREEEQMLKRSVTVTSTGSGKRGNKGSSGTETTQLTSAGDEKPTLLDKVLLYKPALLRFFLGSFDFLFFTLVILIVTIWQLLREQNRLLIQKCGRDNQRLSAPARETRFLRAFLYGSVDLNDGKAKEGGTKKTKSNSKGASRKGSTDFAKNGLEHQDENIGSDHDDHDELLHSGARVSKPRSGHSRANQGTAATTFPGASSYSRMKQDTRPKGFLRSCLSACWTEEFALRLLSTLGACCCCCLRRRRALAEVERCVMTKYLRKIAVKEALSRNRVDPEVDVLVVKEQQRVNRALERDRREKAALANQKRHEFVENNEEVNNTAVLAGVPSIDAQLARGGRCGPAGGNGKKKIASNEVNAMCPSAQEPTAPSFLSRQFLCLNGVHKIYRGTATEEWLVHAVKGVTWSAEAEPAAASNSVQSFLEDDGLTVDERCNLGLDRGSMSGVGPGSNANSTQQGTVFGLLGKNGSGKSSLLKMILGGEAVSAGQIHMLGLDATKDRDLKKIRRLTGYCPQRNSVLYPDLTVYENLALFQSLKRANQKRSSTKWRSSSSERSSTTGTAKNNVASNCMDTWQNNSPGQKSADEEIRFLLRKLKLEKYRNYFPSELSGGAQRKVMVCVSLLDDPQILLLDEPTTSIDPVGRREMWAFLEEFISANGSGLFAKDENQDNNYLMNQQQALVRRRSDQPAGTKVDYSSDNNLPKSKFVFLTTHLLEEAELLCSQVAIQDGGRWTHLGTPAYLNMVPSYRVSVTIRPEIVHVDCISGVFAPFAEEEKTSGNKMISASKGFFGSSCERGGFTNVRATAKTSGMRGRSGLMNFDGTEDDFCTEKARSSSRTEECDALLQQNNSNFQHRTPGKKGPQGTSVELSLARHPVLLYLFKKWSWKMTVEQKALGTTKNTMSASAWRVALRHSCDNGFSREDDVIAECSAVSQKNFQENEEQLENWVRQLVAGQIMTEINDFLQANLSKPGRKSSNDGADVAAEGTPGQSNYKQSGALTSEDAKDPADAFLQGCFHFRADGDVGQLFTALEKLKGDLDYVVLDYAATAHRGLKKAFY